MYLMVFEISCYEEELINEAYKTAWADGFGFAMEWMRAPNERLVRITLSNVAYESALAMNDLLLHAAFESLVSPSLDLPEGRIL